LQSKASPLSLDEEVRQEEGKNLAMFDLFDKRHACNVLTSTIQRRYAITFFLRKMMGHRRDSFPTGCNFLFNFLYWNAQRCFSLRHDHALTCI